MPKLQVSISRELATVMMDNFRHNIEAGADTDQQLLDDYDAFIKSVKLAVQRQQKKERRGRIMAAARKAVKND